MSNSVGGEFESRNVEFDKRKRINSKINRREFLINCIEEQVIPKSTPKQLFEFDHPFPEPVRTYLNNCCNKLLLEISEHKSSLQHVHLPHHLVQQLSDFQGLQQRMLARKLDELCASSEWNNVGRADMVINLSSTPLDSITHTALTLGLKFDLGYEQHSTSHYLLKNSRYRDSEIERGYKQGITTCLHALAATQSKAIPRRFIKSLQALGKKTDVMVMQADKGGATVIMDKTEYDKKMYELLTDRNTYCETTRSFAEEQARSFTQEARRILLRSSKGKKLLHLLEEQPRTPRMYGLPKVHKDAVPMRPITSGIGSAPHALARELAKPLSKKLGSISGCHLTNSADLLNRLKDIRHINKKLVSFDVKALFTNVPKEDSLAAAEEVVEELEEEDLPLPKTDFLELLGKCVHMNSFSFSDNFYKQQSGLAMGSPLSPVLACLLMERLESSHYKGIIGTNSTWLRYVDDILVVVPRRCNLTATLHRLNQVHHAIQFTMEEEIDETLPFLDVLIQRKEEGLRYAVYRKPTSKDNYIHFYSAHSRRTKSGVVIGFFLRALRVCSPENRDEEFLHITSAFEKLRYPKGLLQQLKSKAELIMSRNTRSTNTDPLQGQTDSQRSIIVAPNSVPAAQVAPILSDSSIMIALSSSRKISDLVKKKSSRQLNTNSVVYRIPCNGCQRSYIGETGRGLTKRLQEHQYDMRTLNPSNAIVAHALSSDHLPRWSEAEVLHKGMPKPVRKALEASQILLRPTINIKPGNSSSWARQAANIMTLDWKPKPD